MNDLHDLVAPYALDALPPEERDQFEAHLATCELCQAELADLGESAANIADAVAVAPPPQVKEAVMAAIAEEDAPVAEVIDIDRRRTRLAWTIATAAAVVALVFVGMWSITSGQLTEANRIAAIHEAPDSVVVELETSNGPARFVYSETLGQGVFNGTRLSEVDEGHLYELWLIGADAVEPAGTLDPGESGVLVNGVEAGLTLAMTVEEAPGADAPTTEPLFAAEL